MICWHKWKKWTEVERKIVVLSVRNKDNQPINGMLRLQRRECVKCGFIQYEELT